MIRLSAVTPTRIHHALLQSLSVVVLAQMLGCTPGSTRPDAGVVSLDARPNGVAVSPGDGAVYLTDDATSSVLKASDGRTFSTFAAIPQVAGQGISLSQLVFDDEQNLLVERFGFGSASAVFSVGGPDRVATLAGPDPKRRRLGIAALGSRQALSTWFVKAAGEEATGGVSLLTYDAATGRATERDVITSMGKPVGVVVSGDTVFVSDQMRNVIVRVPLAQLLGASHPITAPDIFARIENPDLMTAGGGALYTRCENGSVCRIASDGAVSEIAQGFHDARGVALDMSRHRLYVIDRAKAGGTSYLRVLPTR